MQENEKGLNSAALLMLLRVIELNGGRIHRGALSKAVNELHSMGLITEKFNPPTPKNHTEYDYLLTDNGQQALDVQKAEKVKQLEVEEIRRKGGRATIIKYQGETYSWQPPKVGKGPKK